MYCRKQTEPINKELYSWKKNLKTKLFWCNNGVWCCSFAGSAHIKILPFLATHFVYFTTKFQTALSSNMNNFLRSSSVIPLKSRHRFSGIWLEYTKRFLELSGHFTTIVGLRSCRHRCSGATATKHFSSSPSYGISRLWSWLFLLYIFNP